jgi:sugar/nucleoside kinase (ribokinase family)
MFEAAFVGAGQTGIRYWVPPMLGPSHGDATLWQWNADADSNLRTVYKIHGTFGEPSDWSKTKLEDAIKDFHGWMQKQLANGTSNTVATGRVYEQIAFKIPNDRFEREYEPVLKILRNQENIVVCVGIGLGAEEHVISRLLSSRGDSFGPVLKLNTATPLELDPSELKGITSINLDLGLAAGSERRFIATACFLECIFRILGKSPSKADTFQQLISRVERPRPSRYAIWPKENAVADTVPLALAFGQTSINRVIGIFDPPTQEQAFAANRANFSPLSSECKPMDTTELGGQSAIPCLVWDALGMPSMLVSAVGDDALGDSAIRELAKTNYLDFDQVHQSATATDSLTVVTWYGLRSIFESEREIWNLQYFDSPFDQKRIDDAISQAHLIYLTKVGYNNWKGRDFGSRLILFDTGGGACPDQTRKVGEKGGIVVASALAAVGEELFDDLANWNATSKFWLDPDKPPKEDIRGQNHSFSETMRKWKAFTLPNNDTGRAHQTWWFLKVLERQKLMPGYLAKYFSRSPAFAVTLGEFGIIYWVNRESDWIGPWRVWCDEQPLQEIRNGLACGDCTRAGTCAALIARASGRPPVIDDFHAAFAFGAWCGTTKLRFFSLEAYRNALHQSRTVLLSQILGRPTEYGDGALKLKVSVSKRRRRKPFRTYSPSKIRPCAREHNGAEQGRMGRGPSQVSLVALRRPRIKTPSRSPHLPAQQCLRESRCCPPSTQSNLPLSPMAGEPQPQPSRVA